MATFDSISQINIDCSLCTFKKAAKGDHTEVRV